VPELGDGALAEPMRFEKMPFVPLDTRLAQHIVVLSHADPPDKIDSSQALPGSAPAPIFFAVIFIFPIPE